jgi:hypothetical protein
MRWVGFSIVQDCLARRVVTPQLMGRAVRLRAPKQVYTEKWRMSMKVAVLAVTAMLLVATPLAAQQGRRLGGYYGTNLGADNPPGNHHVGFLYAAPAFGVFEFYPALEVFLDRLSDGSRWQASMNLRARWHRPNGDTFPFYAGGGLNIRSDTFEPGVLFGVALPWRQGRPFVEFRFFGTDIDRASYNVLAGVTFGLR